MGDVSEQPRQTLITLLLRTAHAMVDELVARMAAAGYPDIGAADSRVFENLDPDGTRLTVLAARAQVTHQAMGELVASLEARGYVERVPDATDRRARLVRFTGPGREMMRVALTEIAAIEAACLERMEPGVREGLRGSLEAGVRDDGDGAKPAKAR